MKKRLVLSLFLVLIFVTTCSVGILGQEDVPGIPFDILEKEGLKDDYGYKIWFHVKDYGVLFYRNCMLAADRVGDKLGLDVRMLAPLKIDAVEEQIRLVEDSIPAYEAGRFDGMVFIPTDYVALGPAIRKAEEAGIPIVVYSNRMDDPDLGISYVGQDHYTFGYASAEEVAKRLNNEGKVIILEGTPAAISAQDRHKGMLDALDKYPGVELIASQTANYKRLMAMEVMETLLQAHSRIDAVICHNDGMAMGAIEAIEIAGRLDEIMVTGIDGMEDALNAVGEGRMEFTIDNSGYRQSWKAMELIVAYLEGLEIERDYLIPFSLVDQSNIQDFYKDLEAIGQPY